MTFNLRFALAEDGANSWEFRKGSVSELFSIHAPDFICLQEVNPIQIPFLSRLLNDYRYIGRYFPSSYKWQDNLIFFRRDWTCLRFDHFFLSDTPKKESRISGSIWPRQGVLGVFKKNGINLSIINTHFDFDSEVQVKSSSLLVSIAQSIGRNLPVFVAGDFNADYKSPAHDLFIASGFKDSISDENNHTFHDFGRKEKGGLIDWILYKGDLENVYSEIIKTEFSGKYPSDHYPVLAEYILKSA